MALCTTGMSYENRLKGVGGFRILTTATAVGDFRGSIITRSNHSYILILSMVQRWTNITSMRKRPLYTKEAKQDNAHVKQSFENTHQNVYEISYATSCKGHFSMLYSLFVVVRLPYNVAIKFVYCIRVLNIWHLIITLDNLSNFKVS